MASSNYDIPKTNNEEIDNYYRKNKNDNYKYDNFIVALPEHVINRTAFFF